MDDDFDTGAFFFGIIIALIMAIIILILALSSTNRKWEREIIERGYAEYTVDVKTKEVNFVWKEIE